MIKAIIVEDEELAREKLRFFLEDFPNVQLIAECGDAISALEALQKFTPICYSSISSCRVFPELNCSAQSGNSRQVLSSQQLSKTMRLKLLILKPLDTC
jgi:DNA-binding NarL/FixJ family response regulator